MRSRSSTSAGPWYPASASGSSRLVVAVLVDRTDRRRPVLLAVDPGQDRVGQFVRAPSNTTSPAFRPMIRRTKLWASATSWMLMMAGRPRSSPDLDDQPHDLPRGLGIERGGRLVDQQQVGVLRQGAGDADALALATGQGVGPLVDMVAQADPVEQGVGLGDGVGRELPEEAAPEADIAEAAGEHVLHDRQPFHQGVFLEDHADPPPRPPERAVPRGPVSAVSPSVT